MTPDAVGHAGYAFLAVGMWMLSGGRRGGWLFRFVGESIWVGVGVWLELSSIWSWGVVFMLIDLRGALHAFRR